MIQVNIISGAAAISLGSGIKIINVKAVNKKIILNI